MLELSGSDKTQPSLVSIFAQLAKEFLVTLPETCVSRHALTVHSHNKIPTDDVYRDVPPTHGATKSLKFASQILSRDVRQTHGLMTVPTIVNKFVHQRLAPTVTM